MDLIELSDQINRLKYYEQIQLPIDEIINFWFPNSDFDKESAFDFWFDKTPDNIIIKKYKNLVDTININNYKLIIKFYELNKYNNDHLTRVKLVLLLIGDQFTRNIYRDNNYISSNINYKKNDKWCLQLAMEMLERSEDLKLNLNMRYFILLVLRHQNKSELLNIVIKRLYQYANQYNKNIIPQSLIKFYSHTIKNYTYLLDEVKLVEPTNLANLANSTNPANIFNSIIESNDIDILDEEYWIRNKNQSTNLLTDQSTNHIIYQTLIDWLKITGIRRIGVSLSGGVDSMVLLSCFYLIKNKNPSLIENIIAVHIEHSNRVEAAVRERDFLVKYCSNLGIRLYYRSIHYMCRETEYLDRSIYEDESKKLRFNLYAYISRSDIENLSGICIGHHNGDITENVFTNIIKGRNTNDLGQMKLIDNQFNVNIYRPLLNLSKDDILNYAHKNLIPYFKNSTPQWSCRGVIRDKIIPILKKQFGHFEANIINFMNNYKELTELNEKYIIDPYINSLLQYTYGYKIPYVYDMILNSNVLDKILIKITHSNGYNMISLKSKYNLINWLKTINSNNYQIPQYELNKGFIGYYENDNKNKFIYFINHTKLAESEFVRFYKANCIRREINNKNIISANIINLDDLLDGKLKSDKDSFIKIKLIKLPQKIKKILFY
jgi:tRNA(Ile)-lysidine synthetase-like protein